MQLVSIKSWFQQHADTLYRKPRPTKPWPVIGPYRSYGLVQFQPCHCPVNQGFRKADR